MSSFLIMQAVAGLIWATDQTLFFLITAKRLGEVLLSYVRPATVVNVQESAGSRTPVSRWYRNMLPPVASEIRTLVFEGSSVKSPGRPNPVASCVLVFVVRL